MFFKFSVVVAGWLVQWYGFVVSGGVVDGFVVLGLWLVVFFFFFLVLMVDYGLLVVVVSGVCVVQRWWACGDGGFSKFVVLEQKE